MASSKYTINYTIISKLHQYFSIIACVYVYAYVSLLCGTAATELWEGDMGQGQVIDSRQRAENDDRPCQTDLAYVIIPSLHASGDCALQEAAGDVAELVQSRQNVIPATRSETF